MKRLSDEIIARYHDGELGQSAAGKVEETLSGSPEDRAALDGVSRVGDLVRLMAEVKSEEVSFDGFEQRVMNSITAESKPSLGERARVWWSEFFAHRKPVWIPTASLAGAAAALLLAFPIFTGTQAPAPVQSGVGTDVWMASALADATQRGSEVTIISNDPAAGVSYSLQNDRGETIGVAWINE